jgi:hypothetical protein
LSISYLPTALRQMVRERAALRCEYCRLAEADAFLPHEPDHTRAEKHDGASTAENLALACFDCNRFKGSDAAAFDPESDDLVPLFNPRMQVWSEHFAASNGVIVGVSPIGRATAKLLKFNLAARVEIRAILTERKRWP